MENKIERNIEYIQNLIEKYEFMKTFQRSIDKIKENPDQQKLNDILRLVSSVLEEKLSEALNQVQELTNKLQNTQTELEKTQEKLKTISEEFNIDEYEKIKQQKEELEKELEQYKSKYQDLMDRYQQLGTAYREIKTEYENFIYRTEKNYEKLKRESKERLISNLIPVIDSFEISLKSMNKSSNLDEIIAGVNLIYSQMTEVLKNEGLEIIKSNPGDKFDPVLHEAIEVQETENQELDSTIIEEYRPAYKLMDKIIRPATVKVYKFVSTNNKTQKEETISEVE